MYAYVLREGPTTTTEEFKIWQVVNASAGFGPNDYPMGMNYPPYSNEENTPNDTPEGPYVDEHGSNSANAPFDEPFYIILNLSVGGDLNGCPNPGYWGPAAVWCQKKKRNSSSSPSSPQPHLDDDRTARTVFWDNRDDWYPTWQQAQTVGRDSLVVDWIKAWQ